jgi:translation initiation factor 3 subunit M
MSRFFCRATAYKFTLTYARLVDPTSSHAQAAAVHVTASALQLPSLFDFDPLLKLELVSNIQKHPIYALLQIFLQNGLAEYQSWVSQNGAVISEHCEFSSRRKYMTSLMISALNTELERKIRLLSMASLAFENVGKDLPYTTIASSLQIDDDAVERWSIDAIRAGLVGGRLSQTQRTFHISRATPRNFGSAQWGVLEQRLLAWQTGLAGVMDVLIAAQKAGGRPAAVVDTTSSS